VIRILRLALLAGLASGLLDVAWHLVASTPQNLGWDMVTLPAGVLAVAGFLVMAAGLLALRFRARRGARETDVAAWAGAIIGFVLVWTLLFGVSHVRLETLGGANGLRVLGVTTLAGLVAVLLRRYLSARASGGSPSDVQSLTQIEDHTLLLVVVLGASVMFLLAELSWIEGLRSPVSILAAGSLIVFCGFALWLFFRHRSGFRVAGAVGVTAILCLAVAVTVHARTLLWFEASESTALQNRPNPIILISVDTLRADYLGCYGATESLTPNLDRLAGQSVLFERAVATSPWTLPSMASIMTGVSFLVHKTGDHDETLPDALETLAAQIRAAGYMTFGVGRNVHLRSGTGMERGFDYYRLYPRKYLNHSLGSQLSKKLLPAAVDSDATSTDLRRLATSIARKAVGGGVFLWLHFFDPHAPYTPPDRFVPEQALVERYGRGFDAINEVRSGRLDPDEDQRRWIRLLYEGEIRYVDDEIGRLLEVLDELDLFDSAMIVVVSDHGEELWDHQGFEHGHTLYDELIHVPLLVKLPWQAGSVPPEKVRVAVPVSIASVLSTILEAAGAPSKAPSLAKSLQRHWSETEPGQRSAIVSGAVHYLEDRISIIDAPYKYIRHLDSGREELYDLDRDPNELQDLAPVETAVLSRLGALLDREIATAEQTARELGISDRGERVPLDEEALRELRALGYIE
jgi:arylsulfatase A-like enzyme